MAAEGWPPNAARATQRLHPLGAVVVAWTVPDFTVDRYRARLRDAHDLIDRDGAFRSTMSRTLIEARKPLR